MSPPMANGEQIDASRLRFHRAGSERVDAATIKLDAPLTEELPTFPVRADALNHGEEVGVLGFPSVPRREPGLALRIGRVESLLPLFGGEVETVQVSCQITGGMSGGPVIDKWGHLVGIVMESTFERAGEGVPAQQIHHVLPVKYLLEVVSDGVELNEPEAASSGDSAR